MSDPHALLIGIDCYLPNQFPDGSGYESLSGSVRDITRVERFLLDDMKLAPERILKLTSSRGGPDGQPLEPRDRWPTYENIVGAFWQLTRAAKPGDQVYIHYSGHGGRTETLFPEIKGQGGSDESLVPCDIGDLKARYLRGVEISWLIRDMLSKELRVTVVFDSCHSGGANRGRKGSVKRGVGIVDRRKRSTESLVASRQELLKLLEPPPPPPGPVRRKLTLRSWLLDPEGYVFLAACKPQEFAVEYPFDGVESQGALTYWLLDSLRQGGTSLSWKQLYERVYAKVHNDFPTQTPLLIGEGDRTFFSAGGEDSPPAVDDSASPGGVRVLGIEDERVLLNIGQAQGARVGMQLAVYPLGAVPGPGAQPVTLEIRQVGATESWAERIRRHRGGGPEVDIEQGAQALPISLGPSREAMRLQAVVALAASAALEKIQAVIVEDPGKLLRLAAEGEEGADFQVTVNAQGDYELLDAKGLPIPNLRPALTVDGVGSAQELVRRLIHLTKYRNVLRIENADDQSPLRKALGLEVLGTQVDFVPGDRPETQPVSGPPPIELRLGEWLFLEVSNRSSRVLNFTVLDLQPDWGISRIFPGRNDAEFWPLDPGETKMVRIQGSLPKEYDEGVDVIKIFATMGAPSFRWLLLPSLDQPEIVRRNMAVSSYASEEWTTKQLAVRLRR
jgi:hypothetical protein